MPEMTTTELDWKQEKDGSYSAKSGMWELCIRHWDHGKYNGWVINPIGDALQIVRGSLSVCMADCHEYLDRLTAGRE